MRRVLSRVFPSPLLSISLLALWVGLQGAFSASDLLMAAVVSVMMPILTRSLRPLPVRIGRPLMVLRLILRVGRDVVVSNLIVARGVLEAPWRMPNDAFVRIPLELRDANGLAALATIMTVIPGTVWSELSLDRSTLLIHVFDLEDEASFIAEIKANYERPLMEIFE